MLDFLLGASYRFAPKWFAGIEARRHNDFGSYNLRDQTQKGFFYGPNVHYAEKEWWATVAWRYQPKGGRCMGDGTAECSDSRVWDSHSRNEVMFKLQEQMRKASSVRHPFVGNRVWRTSDGGWFIVDQVVGKHEMITYALGIKPDGSVQGIEIMEYVESYGYEVAEASWRKQFEGKKAIDSLKLNTDIQNISGATLSCKHLTDGVKRLLVFHALALKNYSAK
jgi:hypothetical protein